MISSDKNENKILKFQADGIMIKKIQRNLLFKSFQKTR